MIINSNMKMAVTCEKCGKISVEELNLFEINKSKELRLTCSCGSLNCTIYSNEHKNINISTGCIYCGREHKYKYKSKDIILGEEMLCPEVGMPIIKIGDSQEVNSYINDIDKNTIEVLYDKNFELFFNNHSIMKKSLEKLRGLKENSKINCDCGNNDIAIEIYSDRVELRCVSCQGIKIIYAENKEDLDTFYKKNKIDIKQSEFEFIDAINNSDHK